MKISHKDLTPQELKDLKKDLLEAENRKIESCVVNGGFSYDKMAQLYHKGKW